MRGYEGWSFRDRPVVIALAISFLWHFFWFFSVTITVNPNIRFEKARPKVVSLGSVIDDTFFRALVQTKPQISETFYRHLSDFSAPLEPEAQTMERRSPGDVVSIPFSERVGALMRSILGGEKTAPDEDFASRIRIGFGEEVPGLEGEVKGRQVLNRPKEPDFPKGFDPSLRGSEVELEFTVKPSGLVSAADLTAGSGNPHIDALWVRYLRSWQFSPLPLGEPVRDQRGRVKFRFRS
ncbi:MAG: TonB family protein [Candidatus Omnitrophota bacterium]